jgi:hypothetical protein
MRPVEKQIVPLFEYQQMNSIFVGSKQGNQIGRIFAYLAVVLF